MRKSSKLVFVVGCGRSGTHYLADVLMRAGCFEPRIENKSTFDLITRASLVPEPSRRLVAKICKRLGRALESTDMPYVLEKSHPAMWIEEQLLECFPSARFVGVVRDPYQTIASMLVHPGVNRWAEEASKYAPESPMLGLSREVSANLAQLSIVQRHAIRWRETAKRLRQLSEEKRHQHIRVNYSSVVLGEPNTFSKMSTFLGHSLKPVDAKSKDYFSKWKRVLSNRDIEQIWEITGVGPTSMVPWAEHDFMDVD